MRSRLRAVVALLTPGCLARRSRRCADYTKWRIVARDVHNVPVQFAPESWGLEDSWLDSVRALRNTAPQEESQCSVS